MPVPPPEPASEPIAAAIDGLALTRAFAAGAEALVRQADALNAINVFPVPDGETVESWLSPAEAELVFVQNPERLYRFE